MIFTGFLKFANELFSIVYTTPTFLLNLICLSSATFYEDSHWTIHNGNTELQPRAVNFCSWYCYFFVRAKRLSVFVFHFLFKRFKCQRGNRREAQQVTKVDNHFHWHEGEKRRRYCCLNFRLPNPNSFSRMTLESIAIKIVPSVKLWQKMALYRIIFFIVNNRTKVYWIFEWSLFQRFFQITVSFKTNVLITL